MNKENNLKKGATILLIIAVMGAVIISYQFVASYDERDNKRDGSKENLTYSDTEYGNSTVNLTEDDRKFQDWTNSISIQGDLYCIARAAERKSLTDTEICGRILKNNTNISLMQIDEFKVSQAFRMAVSEYKKGLELYYLAGESLEIGAKNGDAELMTNATILIDQGKKKISNGHYLLGLVS